MTDTTYNGWKNYPTWAVNLWLSNDEGLYNRTKEITLHAVSFFPGTSLVLTDKASIQYGLANVLKEWVTDELAPDLGATFAADLLGYALALVDWDEISTHWIDDASEVEA